MCAPTPAPPPHPPAVPTWKVDVAASRRRTHICMASQLPACTASCRMSAGAGRLGQLWFAAVGRGRTAGRQLRHTVLRRKQHGEAACRLVQPGAGRAACSAAERAAQPAQQGGAALLFLPATRKAGKRRPKASSWLSTDSA